MEIKTTLVGSSLTLAPQGRVDTITAPELETAINNQIGEVGELIVDLDAVDYISSAGLRVLLSAQKKMAGRRLLLKNACAAVKEVFDITGFSDIFTFG